MDLLGWLLVIVLVILAGQYVYRRTLARNASPTPVKLLLEACGGDQDLAERLIFAEMQRDEDLTIQQAAGAAHARLKRDQVN